MSRTTLTDAEHALFRRWSRGRPSFVADGVVSESRYLSAKPSILFLLKEVNDPGPDGGGFDLREFLRAAERAATWDNVCRWVRGIRSLPTDLPWHELATVTLEQRREALEGIAAVNLKKSPGGHTTVVSTFVQAVREDADFLREQFRLYDADLVICCGSIVVDAFDAHLKGAQASVWQETSRGVKFLEYLPGKHVVAYSHPEARVSANILYYGIVDAVRELRVRA